MVNTGQTHLRSANLYQLSVSWAAYIQMTVKDAYWKVMFLMSCAEVPAILLCVNDMNSILKLCSSTLPFANLLVFHCCHSAAFQTGQEVASKLIGGN